MGHFSSAAATGKTTTTTNNASSKALADRQIKMNKSTTAAAPLPMPSTFPVGMQNSSVGLGPPTTESYGSSYKSNIQIGNKRNGQNAEGGMYYGRRRASSAPALESFSEKDFPELMIPKKKKIKRADFDLETLKSQFLFPLREAATNLGVCEAVLKRICRRKDIQKWPYRKLHAIMKKIKETEEYYNALESELNPYDDSTTADDDNSGYPSLSFNGEMGRNELKHRVKKKLDELKFEYDRIYNNLQLPKSESDVIASQGNKSSSMLEFKPSSVPKPSMQVSSNYSYQHPMLRKSISADTRRKNGREFVQPPPPSVHNYKQQSVSNNAPKLHSVFGNCSVFASASPPVKVSSEKVMKGGENCSSAASSLVTEEEDGEDPMHSLYVDGIPPASCISDPGSINAGLFEPSRHLFGMNHEFSMDETSMLGSSYDSMNTYSDEPSLVENISSNPFCVNFLNEMEQTLHPTAETFFDKFYSS